MSDIIEELRNRTTGVILLSDPPQFKKDGLCQQAANEIERLRAENEKLQWELGKALDTLVVHDAVCAENEKLRSDVRTAVFADSAELKDVKRYNEELRGLLREAWVKMEANNLWSNLRARVAAALKETGDE